MKYICNLCHTIVEESEYSNPVYFCPKCGVDKSHFKNYIELESTNKKVFISNKNPSINRIIEKCINCGICTKTCNKVTGLNLDKNIHECVNCGNCLTMCPTGALCPVYNYRKVMNIINKKENVLVAFTAPAVRTSLGECFNMDAGQNTEGKMVTALKNIGFNYILDTAFASDVTIMEESKELMNRLKTKKNLPMFTSCCPAWVKYVEMKHPELIKNLSSTKSPNSIMGALVKSYFSEIKNIPKEKIITVGIVPCTAKKYESKRKELTNDNLKNVDYMLTTTELAMMIREKNIDFKTLKDSNFDSLMGKTSSSGVIFGSTGGVMISTLRALNYKLSNKNVNNLTFTNIRSTESIKKMNIKIANQDLNIAVIFGLTNIEKVLKEIKDNKEHFDFIEVMACPSGCIGGAGNPLPNINKLEEVRDKRIEVLNKIDENSKIKTCFENTEVNKLYNNYLNKERINSLLHTTYSPK